MRRMACVVALAAACGGSSAKKFEDGPGPIRDGAPIDGAMFAPCGSAPVSGTKITAVKIGTVSGSAILATSPPVPDTRLFVIEQAGRIRLFVNEQLQATPFLDIHTKLVAGGEQGLLGLAFHPQYATNGYFYVWYTATNPNTADTANPWVDVLERYSVSTNDPNAGDPNSGMIILSVPDFASNHNGGMLEFGLDGMLYVGTGDGGSGGDPHHNAQNLDPASADCMAHGNLCQTKLGKVLRIDVDHPANGKPYGIPSDNPFLTSPTPEAYMIGVRNPWRWTFDRANGDMWIGDVGQNLIEELDVIPVGAQAGKNLGWSVWEADACYGNYPAICSGSTPCASVTGYFCPQSTWNHTTTAWRAIIGGQVYRGSCYPDIVGNYYFSDNSEAGLHMAQLKFDGSVTVTDLGAGPASPSAIHADSRGELYETTTSGNVYHLEAGP